MDRSNQALVSAAVSLPLAFILIVLRCISRFFITNKPGIEDYLIITAFVLSVGLTIGLGFQINNGLGQHSSELPVSQVENSLKLSYMSVIVYNLGLLVIKTSLLFQYLRIFVHKAYRHAAWGMMIFTWLGGTALILIGVFACRPLRYYWDKSINGSCIKNQPLWYAMASFQLSTDLATLILPIPVLLKIQLPKKEKIILIFIFLLGGFACIVSVLRLHGIYAASISNDPTYSNPSLVIWGTVEINTAIICACFPALRPIFKAILPKLAGSRGRDTTPSNPFQQSSHSRNYYHRQNDSTVELSSTVIPANTPGDNGSSDQISFDTATNEPGMRVKQEWSVTEQEDVELGKFGRVL